MGRFSNKPARMGGSALLALLGAIYCLAADMGLGEALCVTSGCSLYQEFSLYGISLWHVGIAVFLVLAALSFMGRLNLAFNLSGLTILADCFLLLLMSLTSPCLACMGAAFFLAIVFWSLHHTRAERGGAKPPYQRSRLLGIWMLFMAAAAVLAIKELAAPNAWHGPEDAPVRLYFSPNCPACLEAVRSAAHSPVPVAYYPVAVSLDEVKIILAMEEDLAKGLPLAESLHKFRTNPPPDLTFNLGALKTLAQILRNRADALSLGNGSVPLILINGMPSWEENVSGVQPPPPLQADLEPAVPPGLFLDLNTGQCVETTGENCEEPQPSAP